MSNTIDVCQLDSLVIELQHIELDITRLKSLISKLRLDNTQSLSVEQLHPDTQDLYCDLDSGGLDVGVAN